MNKNLLALIMGICSLVLCWFPWGTFLAIGCGVVGLIFGIKRDKVNQNAMGLTGMILSICGLALAVVFGLPMTICSCVYCIEECM